MMPKDKLTTGHIKGNEQGSVQIKVDEKSETKQNFQLKFSVLSHVAAWSASISLKGQ